MDPLLAGGHWLVLALSRLSERLGVAAPVPAWIGDRVRAHLLRLDEDRRAFSIVPVGLAGSGSAPGQRPGGSGRSPKACI
jgi:hypothetical protein